MRASECGDRWIKRDEYLSAGYGIVFILRDDFLRLLGETKRFASSSQNI